MTLHHLFVADTPAGLRRALDDLDDLDVVGVDVERADGDRYWRSAALVQVGGQGRVAVIDPLALPDMGPLHAFLAARTTLLHAADNDLGPLQTLGVDPPLVEDTAIAAALLGMPTGLETLLADVCGVTSSADKSAMQRADWEARPLDEAMLRYAAGDVADLPALWTHLASRLAEHERSSWYRQERDATLALPPAEERRDWQRTRGAGRLDAQGRTRLRVLWQTREELAQHTDTAPGRIASDRVLVDLAERPPARVDELGRRGVRRQAVRHFGEALLGALHSAERQAPEHARHGGTRPPTQQDRTLTDKLRTLRAERAQVLGIDPGVLCPSRRLLTAILQDPPDAEALRTALELRDWQWEQIGEAFCQALGLDTAGTLAPTPTTRSRAVADVLEPDVLDQRLAQLDDWSGDPTGITKRYTFDDFPAAVAFVNRVAELAEAASHHPDIDVRYNAVTLALATHSAGGVTDKDLDLAAQIEDTAT